MMQNAWIMGQEVGEMNIIQTSGIDLKLDVTLFIYRTVMLFDTLYPEP